MPTGPNFTLSPTSADEADQVVNLARDVGIFSPERAAAVLEWVNDYVAKGEASMYRFLSCRRAGNVIGYSCCGPRWLTQSTFDLYSVCVAPGEQGQGVGTALLWRTEQAICALAGDLVILEVSALPRYDRARRFFETRGYRIEAAIADFYADGEGLILYSKRLDPLSYGVEANPLEAKRIRRLQKESLGYVVDE